jgi:xanthine/uracil/vitamin C permease (AzgA family)
MALWDGIQDKVPVMIASFAGAVVSVVIRGDRAVWTGFGNFSAGFVIGFYFGGILAIHVGISEVAGSVIMALAGRQIASWLTGLSVKEMVALFTKGKTP